MLKYSKISLVDIDSLIKKLENNEIDIEKIIDLFMQDKIQADDFIKIAYQHEKGRPVYLCQVMQAKSLKRQFLTESSVDVDNMILDYGQGKIGYDCIMEFFYQIANKDLKKIHTIFTRINCTVIGKQKGRRIVSWQRSNIFPEESDKTINIQQLIDDFLAEKITCEDVEQLREDGRLCKDDYVKMLITMSREVDRRITKEMEQEAKRQVLRELAGMINV